jgi:pimeloyl-ACP methyl ester carboxylesterase
MITTNLLHNFLSVLAVVPLLATTPHAMMGEVGVLEPVNPFPDCTKNGRDYIDVPYWNTSEDPNRQMLDLYLPATGGPFPVVVFFHGGGFNYGDKDEIYDAAFHEYLNLNGIGYALVNYRFSTNYPFRIDDPSSTPYPVSMWDSARAIQTLRYWSDYLNINPNQIALMGRSAGAGIVQWLAFHDNIADPLSTDPIQRESSKVSCISPIRGQTTYDPRVIQRLFPARKPSDLSLDPGIMSLYGLDAEEYDENRDYYDEIYSPSYREASPSEHVDESDDVFVIAYYNFRLDDHIDNIHDPEFMAYMGIPDSLVEATGIHPYDSLSNVRYVFEWGIPRGGLVERYPEIADIMMDPCGCNLPHRLWQGY